MARRRKIPGKKHHGVNDPAQQKRAREALVKHKVNAAPKNGGDQDQALPKKLLDLMRAKEEAKRQPLATKVKKAKVEGKQLLDSSKFMDTEMRLPGMTKPLKPIPLFKQEEGESKRKFFNRMEATVKSVLQRKEYENKFDVDVVDDPVTGKSIVKDREKDEIDQLIHSKKAAKLKKKKGIVVKTKEEKRAIRRLAEKEKRLKKKRRLGKILNELGSDDEDFKEFEDFRDEVSLNEVAMAPPTLGPIKGKMAAKKAERAEKTGCANVAHSDLLLSKQFGSKKNLKKSGGNDVSLARKHMLDLERERVMEAYRSMKVKKMSKVKI